MTDLTDLLDSAAGHHPAPTPDVVAADLARGRRALLHRRWTRTGLAVAGVAAVGAAAVAVPAALGNGEHQVRVVGPAVGGVASVADAPNPGVDLVDFDTTAPLKPISPAVIPAGWTVGGNEYALVISPPGDTTSPDDFRGKLVVYVDANDVANEPLPTKLEVAVGDRTGYAIRDDASALQVWVPQADGTSLRAQAPPSLRWDEATLGRFLGAVTVSDAAVAGVG